MMPQRWNIRINRGGPSSGFDFWLLMAVLFLSVIGLIMVMSSSGVMAERVWNDSNHFVRKQFIFFIIGLTVMGFALRLKRDFFYRHIYLWLVMSLALLIMTITPLGTSAGGARRWLSLGFFAVQPLEMAKVALVFYLASFFSRKQEMVKTFSVGFLPPTLVTGMFCILLVIQPDFGGAVFMVALLFIMSLVGGTRIVYLGSSASLALALGTYLVLQSPYRFRRVFAFLDPFEDIHGAGWQLVQSLYALGTGGFWGLGLGGGNQKLFFLPEAHNDFILSVAGEELGFVGLSLIFSLLAVVLWRSFSIALAQGDLQDKFAGLGMASILAVGSLLNAAVVLGVVPPKGVPMPFVSYGGSNLLVSFFCVGFLLNLSWRRS